MLLPLANQLLGHRAFAQGTVKRVIFFYYPNGNVSNQWQPSAGSGSISNGSPLSFSLAPLQNHHDKIICLKNMYLTGIPSGGHDEAAQNILSGKAGLGDNEATVDHILAEVVNSEAVTLGVRTGQAGNHMVSKARGFGNGSRPIPNNDPKDAADKLFVGLGESNNSGDNALREQMLDTVLADIADLKSLSLQGMAKTKVEKHEQALERIKSQIEQTLGDCNLVKTTVTDPYKNGAQAGNYEHWKMIPNIARAQIDNAVGALACGVSKVATVQMMCGGENVSLANYCFDECWGEIEAAYSVMGGSAPQRWYNEHSSHTASHAVFPSHAGQCRWYVSQFAYLLDKLSEHQILDDTIAVMLSEVGDGNIHGPFGGGVIVAGGTGGALSTGRIIDCQARTEIKDNGFQNHFKTTQQLFVDLGALLGGNVQGQNGWGSGGVIV